VQSSQIERGRQRNAFTCEALSLPIGALLLEVMSRLLWLISRHRRPSQSSLHVLVFTSLCAHTRRVVERSVQSIEIEGGASGTLTAHLLLPMSVCFARGNGNAQGHRLLAYFSIEFDLSVFASSL